MIDPFGILDIVSIKFDRSFISYIDDEIDDEILKSFTEECVVSDWEDLLDNRTYIYYSNKTKEKLIKFVWFICKIILYRNDLIEHKHPITINLQKFCRKNTIEKNDDNIAKIFINSIYNLDIKENYKKISLYNKEIPKLEIIFKNINYIRI